MANISVRLPPEIEKGLEEEARLTDRNRSELVREAVGEYLTRRQKERMIEEMRQAAKALYSNPEAVREGLEAAEEGLEDWLASIEREERAAGIDPDAKWWD
ncbi:MAG: ribbon-helix-helix protein, CopG family [Wenzhouxiangellaceae bacterium]